MKKSILTGIILTMGILISSALMTGCGGKSESGHDHTAGDSAGHDEMHSKQVAYACPMHPEVTGKEGDTCNKCGMKLEPVKADSTEAEHQH